MSYLSEIVTLSHVFGTSDYVRGGGGNTSCKDGTTLWVKKSGTFLGTIDEEGFVALQRSGLEQLLNEKPPADPAEREKWVKEHMMQALMPDSPPGRPSVEAPVHHCFAATYVVHTHPPLVNGITCAARGYDAMQKLFPEGLWVPYVDPGYTLSTCMRDYIGNYRQRKEKEPRLVFLQNHGIFIAADSPQEIKNAYKHVMDILRHEYQDNGMCTEPHAVEPLPDTEKKQILELCRNTMDSAEAQYIAGESLHPIPHGPLSPDHVVYAKPFPLYGAPTEANIRTYTERHGFQPKAFVTDSGVFGIGPTLRDAELTCEFALDGGFVEQLTQLFGGPRYMTKREYLFIVNWEAEAHRRQMAQREG